MMGFPSKAVVDSVKESYPVGTRVELVKMEDRQAPSIGTQGTVMCVDDTATIFVRWDTGGRLGVVYGEDEVRKVK